MKPLPIKISPERLKDTIVEVRYTSPVPFDILLGQLYTALKNDFHATSINNSLNILPPEVANFIKFEFHNNNFFENEKIRLQLFEERIVFNSNGDYIGWANYYYEIQKILKKLSAKGFLDQIQRVGLRYVSEFPGIKIFENLVWQFNFEWNKKGNINTTFKTEWADEKDKVIVNLVNNAQQDERYFSMMDLDVNHTFSEPTNIKSVLKKIEQLHRKEKSIFFGLMKPQFLESLHPTY